MCSCPSCNLTIIYCYQGTQIQVDTALDLIKGLEKYHLFVEPLFRLLRILEDVLYYWLWGEFLGKEVSNLRLILWCCGKEQQEMIPQDIDLSYCEWRWDEGGRSKLIPSLIMLAQRMFFPPDARRCFSLFLVATLWRQYCWARGQKHWWLTMGKMSPFQANPSSKFEYFSLIRL